MTDPNIVNITANIQTQKPHVYELQSEQELRFEIDFGVTGTFKLLEGTAEYFGTELSLRREYTLSASKGAIYTWSGCKIEMTNCSAYIGLETPMKLYSNVFKHLDDYRNSILDDPTAHGPRVIIAGPTDSGKSSISKILLNYSARWGFHPVYIDLDPGQGGITLPGTISASLIDGPIDIESGLSTTIPFVQYYGHASLDINPNLFKAMMESLASNVDKRLESNDLSRLSGYILNTCGWIEDLGYNILLSTVDTFKANFIIVMDNEKLYSDLSRHYSNSKIKIIKLPKSGGVYYRSSQFRKKTRMSKIKEYFYGINDDLSPHYVVLDFKDVTLFRTGGGPVAPLTALPIGAQSSIDPLQITETTPSIDMTHSVLGISYAKQPQNLLQSNIAGFLYITEINMETKKITALAPSPGPLPSKYLLVGTLKWIE